MCIYLFNVIIFMYFYIVGVYNGDSLCYFWGIVIIFFISINDGIFDGSLFKNYDNVDVKFLCCWVYKFVDGIRSMSEF